MDDDNSIGENSAGIQDVGFQRLKSGANWFYWIAGLSIINSIIAVFGGDIYFVVGLGMNHLVNGFISAIADVDFNQAEIGLRLFAFIINACIACVFILFGYYANNKKGWAFIIGMVLYTIDGLIFLMVSDFLSIGFHIFALYNIYRGFSVSKQLNRLEAEAMMARAGLAQPIK